MEALGVTVAVLAILLLGAVFVRLAVWISNRCLDPQAASAPIPQPGLFKAMGLVLLVFVAFAAFGFVVSMARDWNSFQTTINEPAGFRPKLNAGVAWFAWLFSAITGFLIWCWTFSTFLPTSIPRAALVTLFVYLLLIGFSVILGGLLTVAGALPHWLTKGVTH
jgi:hypothetical protein